MDVDSFRALLADSGRAATDAATAAPDARRDPLVVATDVRRFAPGLSPGVAAAAITQAPLRRRGRAKFGAAADRMWFTPDGVEQATRAEVADHLSPQAAIPLAPKAAKKR